jgi:alkanesulfonate monooxygenase SsuD/methylene tetrahydromethanopterin reductase-like flavin-dependent oxidoreductase (luciferase family)
VGLNETFGNRGRRQAEQVRLMRQLWTEDSIDYTGDYHRIDLASIKPRPSEPVPVWFGGSAPALLKRCGELGDGWIPLGSPNEKTAAMIEKIREHRQAAGLAWDGFGIQAQAQFAGGTAERWAGHAEKWQALGATHLAIATHNAGETDVDGHLGRIEEYLKAVR